MYTKFASVVMALGLIACVENATDESTDPSNDEQLETSVTCEYDSPIEEEPTSIAPDDGANVLESHTDRYSLAYGSCHTFSWLKSQADNYCYWHTQQKYMHSCNRNYTYGCSGWWGSGAMKIWFSCCTWI